jgi:hypothetical protein
MAYILRFSDAAKTGTVYVPEMPPGINAVDTSLALVGRGYPNYAEKFAENFLHLLENFSGPIPPNNPIEGQLWYDTSDPERKVIRVMDGTATSTRWPSANGIYQQGTDPRLSSYAALRVGDIWVDSTNNQLKIYSSGDWTTVGPSFTTGTRKTGPEAWTFDDAFNISFTHDVILNWANGFVVSVISSENEFTPRSYPSGMEGFTKIKPGITLRTKDLNQVDKYYNLNGTAFAAQNLEISGQIWSASSFFSKTDTGNVQSVISRATFEHADGITVGPISTGENFQILKSGNNAVIANNVDDGSIILKTTGGVTPTLQSTIIISRDFVGINTSTYSIPSNPLLDVYGSARILNTLTVKTIDVEDDIEVSNLTVVNHLTVTSSTTCTGLVSLGSTTGQDVILKPNRHNTYDIGMSTCSFRSLYVSTIASTGTGTIVYGTLKGSATRLEDSTEFKIIGQVTATSFLFSGTGTTATFDVSLTRDAIAAQETTSTIAPTQTLLVLNTATGASVLQKINRHDFLHDVVPVGTVSLFAGLSLPDGWVWCNGAFFDGSPGTEYADLYSVIGLTYGGVSEAAFQVPLIYPVVTNVNYMIKL